MSQSLNIYDAFTAICDTIGVNSGYGSALEWQQILKEWSVDPTLKDIKFPMIWMFTPIGGPLGGESKKYIQNVSAEVVIVAATDKNYHTPQRVELIYKPTLWPLYDSFMEALRFSGYFDLTTANDIEHNKTDLFFYSTSPAKEQNVLAAYLDAVQLTDLELKFRTRLPEECLTVEYFNVVHNGDDVVMNGDNVTHKIVY